MYLSERQEFAAAVILVGCVLVGIYHYLSQEWWVFAVSILAVWPLADWLHEKMCEEEESARGSPHPIGFLVYAGAIIIASAIATAISSFVLTPLGLPNSNSGPISFATVIAVSFAASFAAYVVSNWEIVKEMLGPQYD